MSSDRLQGALKIAITIKNAHNIEWSFPIAIAQRVAARVDIHTVFLHHNPIALAITPWRYHPIPPTPNVAARFKQLANIVCSIEVCDRAPPA
jgi:hypothetical protein